MQSIHILSLIEGHSPSLIYSSRFGFGCIDSMAGYSPIMEFESSFYSLVFPGVCVGDIHSSDFG